MKLKMNSMSRNMIASLICRAVTVFAGLIVQRHILVAFGSTYSGLTSLISQIMSYLVLLEAGLGAASIQAFYEPLNNDDWKRVSGIMNATSSSYTKIGVMFGGLLVGGSLLVPLVASGEVDFFIAGLLTLVTGAGNIFTYIYVEYSFLSSISYEGLDITTPLIFTFFSSIKILAFCLLFTYPLLNK